MTKYVPSMARTLAAGSLVLVAGLGLTACGGQHDAGGASTASASASSGSGLEVKDAWIKSADSGMSAAFGTITNTSDHAVTITQASSDASSSMQLHETVMDQDSGSSTMREKKGGFTIKPGESLELKPGGEHIMFMDLKCSLQAGDDETVTLTTSDGKHVDLTGSIRDYAGAQEHYDPSAKPSASGTQAMDMGEHGSGGHGSMDAGTGHGDMQMPPSSSALPSCHG